MSDFGLGAIQSPPDPRDYSIDALYLAAGEEVPVSFPASYVVPGYIPPVYNQGSTPRCVAFSCEFVKAYQDRIDQGQFFPFDEAKFFIRIGGTSAGAIPRNAFAEMLHAGYPVDVVDQASQHRIASYYLVPVTQSAIQGAIQTFGPIVISLPWYNSDFNPTGTGILRSPSGGLAGGHAIAAYGWDYRGLRLRNSWGASWGVNGDCWLPWSQLSRIWDGWKAVDVIEPKPPTGVVLRYGGFAGYRGNWKIMFSGCHFRNKPYTTATIIATVGPTSDALDGYVVDGMFRNSQTTDTGSLVSGSRRWLGDATGTKWIHSSLVSLVR
jgi:hypothetical protein